MSQASQRLRLKPILLPVEHGGWGLISAPLIVGLSVAPTWPGALISLAAMAMFLARQPLKIAAKDVLRRKLYPRTAWATGFALGELSVAAAALLVAVTQSNADTRIALGLLVVLSALQFALEVQSQGRAIMPELLGAAAAAMFASVIAFAGATHPEFGWSLAGALAVHGWLAIAYVTRRLDHHQNTSLVVLIAAISVALSTYVVAQGWLLWPAIAAFTLLALRALWGISPWRSDRRAQIVGVQEVGYTLLLAVGLILANPLRYALHT